MPTPSSSAPTSRCGVLGPVLCRPDISFVKGFYRRPFRVGETTFPDGGGRVTELTARPAAQPVLPGARRDAPAARRRDRGPARAARAPAVRDRLRRRHRPADRRLLGGRDSTRSPRSTSRSARTPTSRSGTSARWLTRCSARSRAAWSARAGCAVRSPPHSRSIRPTLYSAEPIERPPLPQPARGRLTSHRHRRRRGPPVRRSRTLQVPVGAAVAQLGGRVAQRAERGEGERATDRYPRHPERGELRGVRDARHSQHAHRQIDGLDDASNVFCSLDPRREQHVGARLLVGLQTGDRVGQVISSADVVLGTRGEDEVDRARVGGLGGGRNALPRQVQLVDLAAGVVLHRATRQSRPAGSLDRVGDALGTVGEAVLQVGRHGSVRARGQDGCVVERLVSA